MLAQLLDGIDIVKAVYIDPSYGAGAFFIKGLFYFFSRKAIVKIWLIVYYFYMQVLPFFFTGIDQGARCLVFPFNPGKLFG